MAAAADKAQPPGLQPVPDQPPPLPPADANDTALAPQVTIIRSTDQVVEEYRINGHLYMVKVTPSHGVPYFLIDSRGDGVFTRQQSLDNGLRVPQWVLFRF